MPHDGRRRLGSVSLSLEPRMPIKQTRHGREGGTHDKSPNYRTRPLEHIIKRLGDRGAICQRLILRNFFETAAYSGQRVPAFTPLR